MVHLHNWHFAQFRRSSSNVNSFKIAEFVCTCGKTKKVRVKPTQKGL